MIRMYTKAALIAVVAGGLNLAVVAPSQAYTGHPAEGRKCSFTSVTDPTIESGGVQTGQINGGPLVATSPGATISMRCTIQVGASNNTHAGADSCAVQSPPTLQVTAIPPTLCSYDSPEGQPVYMCTEITVNGETWYWNIIAVDPLTGQQVGEWSKTPGNCAEAISQEIFPGPFEPVIVAIDVLVVCPILDDVWDDSALDVYPFRVGDDGDLDDADLYVDMDGDNDLDAADLFWDCPPYIA